MKPFTWPHGVLSALLTPMDAAENLDFSRMREFVDGQVRGGVAGFVVGGGTGEFGALSVAERKVLTEAAIVAVDGRRPVVVQTGALATRDVLDLGRHAADAGADAQLVASPFGEPISWAERLAFYEAVDASTRLPVMLYNTPPSGLLTFEQIEILARFSSVTAVKDSSGRLDLLADLVAWADDGFGVYVGADSLLFEAVCAGARGAVFGTPNVLAAELSDLVGSLKESGSTPENQAAWRVVSPFLREIEESPNYIAACKGLSARLGIDVGPVRKPYLPLSSDELDELETLLRRALGSTKGL